MYLSLKFCILLSIIFFDLTCIVFHGRNYDEGLAKNHRLHSMFYTDRLYRPRTSFVIQTFFMPTDLPSIFVCLFVCLFAISRSSQIHCLFLYSFLSYQKSTFLKENCLLYSQINCLCHLAVIILVDKVHVKPPQGEKSNCGCKFCFCRM